MVTSFVKVTDFVNNAIIIDDKPEEISELLKVLKEQDIVCSSFNPTELSNISFKKNRQLIFLDLSLDDSKKMIDNIALIRQLFKKSLGTNFGIYGIVVWSKHQQHIDLLKEKLQEDKKNKVYSTPIFIVNLNKTKYLQQGNYNGLFNDIESVLVNDPATTFFLEWSNSVQQAKNKTIEKIYSLMPNYEKQSNDITAILTTLALNYTGINKDEVERCNYPLYIDAFKAFDEILYGELINSHISNNKNIVDLKKEFSDHSYLQKIYAQLNSAILVDDNNIDQNTVIPGNVYEIKNAENKFISGVSGVITKSTITIESTIVKNIVIEMTPPCDFSNSGKRIRARLIGGVLVDAYTETEEQIKKWKCKKECFYSEVYPIMVSSNPKPQLLILDFRYFGMEEDNNLQDASKYQIIFRTKPKLFADILQKFSAHAARLGLSIIHS